MAASNDKTGKSGKSGSSNRGNGNRSNGRAGAIQAIRAAREQMRELTGRQVESVLGVRRADEGGWEALVEVVELRRVPDSTDVLASYLLVLDDDCELQEYRRTRRYYRNQVEED